MLNRRSFAGLFCASALAPQQLLAATPKKVEWDDLIPPGVPYAEIIGEGFMDVDNDLWNPIYDDNATKLNKSLDGAYIRMPGFIVPLDVSADGVRDFLLVPYVGACIHTPPPPPNQLVMVNTEKPWPSDQLWDPVWVTGRMRTEIKSTQLGRAGYVLTAEKMEVYKW